MIKTALALLFAVSISQAQASEMYASFKIGKTKHNIPGVVNTPTAYGAYAGYTLNPNLAAEIEYQDLGNFGESRAYTRNIGALLLYPGDETLSLYVKLSYATTIWKAQGQKQRNTAFTQGLGIQYNATSRLAYRFSWDRFLIGNPNSLYLDALGFSAIFRF
ncbi:MAG: outer membrane beta-barrel protein [Gallionella sp.]